MLHRMTLLAAAAALLLAVAAVTGIGAAGSQAAPLDEKKKEEPLATAAEPGPTPLPEVASTIQRTFVSTEGSDSNPCTRAQPCRGFAAAIANTTAGGEVVALDSGGYGTFTVPKAITIVGAPGEHVAVTAFTGTAIHVNAGPTDTVVLRNLYLTGLGATTGIWFQAGGTLHVESVVASGFFGNGLHATAADATLIVRDGHFRRNSASGVRVAGSLRTEIADSRADRNGDDGFSLRDGARGSIVRTEATRNGDDGFEFASASFSVVDVVADANGFGAYLSGTAPNVTLSGATLSNNTHVGLLTDAGVGRISGSTVVGNTTGLRRFLGTLETFGDNLVRGNTTETSGTITTVGKT